MIFTEHGGGDRPAIILLHGGGLSDWSWGPVVSALGSEYRVLTPIIDGHGRDAGTEFESIERCAAELLDFIDSRLGGQALCVAGLSLGAQIALEALCQRGDAARFALIESALVCPIPLSAALAGPSYALTYSLIKKRWFAAAQARALGLPDQMFPDYYADSCRMTRQSLINITISNGRYSLKPSAADIRAKALIAVGERELPVMRRSAHMLREAIPGSDLYTAPGCKHGQLSLTLTEEYVALMRRLMGQ